MRRLASADRLMRRSSAAHDGLRMPHWMRRCVYVAGIACLASGVSWLLFHHFIRHEGSFGPEAHPLERVSLAVHGAAALAMAWAFGLVWLAHVRRGWHRGRNRKAGAVMVATLAVLGASGWGLYYFGDETWRAATSLLHWIVGLAASAWLPWHIWLGRRALRRSSLTPR
jgi:hypothetical protein